MAKTFTSNGRLKGFDSDKGSCLEGNPKKHKSSLLQFYDNDTSKYQNIVRGIGLRFGHYVTPLVMVSNIVTTCIGSNQVISSRLAANFYQPDQFNQHKGCQSITVEYFYCMYCFFMQYLMELF